MFDHQMIRFRLFKVLVIAHIFIACFPLFQSASGDRSGTLAAYRKLERREPAHNFRAFEADDSGKLLLKTKPIYNAALDENGNYGFRRSTPTTTFPRLHYRKSNTKKTEPDSKKRNVNVNMNNNVPLDTDIASLLAHVTYEDSDRDSTVSELEAKLYGCVVFRGNIIKVFGQILNAPNNGLTIDQYTSLNLILQSLIHKHVYMFNLLPVLKKIQGADKKTQFRVVMQALVKQVPVYLACSCKFWVNQIDDNHIDIEQLIASIKQPADFLADIDAEVIDTCKMKVTAEELEPFDEASIITKNTIGPVFVNIFSKLRDRQIIFTQKLFGAVLINMPISKLDPILEEYVNYIWDVTQQNQLTNWDKIVKRIHYGNPYEIIFSAIIGLLNRKDTSNMDRTALQYILLHLKDVSNAVPDEYYEDMGKLLDKDLNVQLLFSIVPNDPAIPEIDQLKNRMIAYLQANKDILQHFNKYVYNKPVDLLIALLTRIQGTIQKQEIKDVVSKLLSILTSKRELDIFALSVSPNVDFLTLLNFPKIADPYYDRTVLIMQLENYFKSNLNAVMILQSIILNEDKHNCNRPMQCLLHVFTEAVKPQNVDQIGIPSSVVTIMKEFIKSLVTAMNDSVECNSDVIYVECPDLPHCPIDLEGQSTPQISETTSTIILESSNPTVPSSPIISTDYQEPTQKPVYPNESDNESLVDTTITHDPLEEVSQPTLTINNSMYPEGSSEHPSLVDITEPSPMPTHVSKPSGKPESNTKPKPGSIPKPKPPSLPKPKPPSTLKPKPRPPFRPVVKPSPIFTIIQGFRPPLIPLVVSPIKFPNKRPILRPPTLPPTIAQDYVPENQPYNEYTGMGPQFHPVENGPVLPPNIYYDQAIFIVFPSGDAPPYIVPEKPRVPGDFGHIIEFPPIKELLKGFSAQKQFEVNELPDLPEIFRPLEQMFGPNFIEKILGKNVDKSNYPTAVSLIDDLLEHALGHPMILENTELALSIQLYLKGIDYLSTTALFPVVIDSRKILSDVLHVTFDPNNPNANSVDSEPPRKIPAGFTTLSIYHPKYWVQLVDPVNPYSTLLPNFEGDEDNPIQKLMNDGSVQEILGPNFDPLMYPNKGTLLTAVLQRLMFSNQVKSKPLLMKKLNEYLESIRTVALFSKVPTDYYTHFREFQQSNRPNWQPDTTSLIKALPPPHNQSDLQKIDAIKSLLGIQNLLDALRIDIPSYYTTRGALLKMIFRAAIQGDKLPLNPELMAALKYYQNKILTRGNGALPIVWTWVGMFILREEIPLGEVIEAVLDYDTLPADVRPDYNDLMTYLSENPNLLQGNDDFAFDRYHTKGTFLRGLFKHFIKKDNVTSKAKRLLKKITPFIAITGRGMQPMNYVSVNNIANRRLEKREFSVLRNG